MNQVKYKQMHISQVHWASCFSHAEKRFVCVYICVIKVYYRKMIEVRISVALNSDMECAKSFPHPRSPSFISCKSKQLFCQNFLPSFCKGK